MNQQEIYRTPNHIPSDCHFCHHICATALDHLIMSFIRKERFLLRLGCRKKELETCIVEHNVYYQMHICISVYISTHECKWGEMRCYENGHEGEPLSKRSSRDCGMSPEVPYPSSTLAHRTMAQTLLMSPLCSPEVPICPILGFSGSTSTPSQGHIGNTPIGSHSPGGEVSNAWLCFSLYIISATR